MKMQRIKRTLLVLAAAIFAFLAWKAPAQNAPAANAVPQLPYGVMQVVQLEQAKLGDETILAYVRNAGITYVLTADQIVYLKQQGVSDAVITALLTQQNAGPSAPPVTQAAPVTTFVPVTPAPPVVTYVRPAPVYYPYYYYPGYYGYPHPFFPGVGVGWSSRGGWRVGVRF